MILKVKNIEKCIKNDSENAREKIDDETFVSCSKDNTIKTWNCILLDNKTQLLILNYEMFVFHQ